MGKILLFYKYVHITYPKQILKWQKKLCESLGLKGRIILAHEGINATVGGTEQATDAYKKAMEEHELFQNIDFKESDGGADYFPRLRIVIKDEIVHLGLDTEAYTPENGGIHLTPEQTHELLCQKKEDLIILDARNNYESRIGTFENAITPDIDNFRDFPEYVDAHKEMFKDKEVLMFCTGGIRCERATTYLKSKKIAKEVYQIEGGIHRYAEEFPDGYFKGKNYVFDGRVSVSVTDDILTSCDGCDKVYDEYSNCINASCNKRIIMCPDCITKYINTCGDECAEKVQGGHVPIRKHPNRVRVS
jgi:predicted sulfurtransferase